MTDYTWADVGEGTVIRKGDEAWVASNVRYDVPAALVRATVTRGGSDKAVEVAVDPTTPADIPWLPRYDPMSVVAAMLGGTKNEEAA